MTTEKEFESALIVVARESLLGAKTSIVKEFESALILVAN